MPLVAFFVSAGSAFSVDFDQSTGDMLYDDGEGNTLPYRLFLPKEYDPMILSLIHISEPTRPY